MSSDTTDTFNDGFVQMMYESWLADPSSVGTEWQEMFTAKPQNAQPAQTEQAAQTPATVAAVVTPKQAPPQTKPAPATPAAAAPAAPVSEGATPELMRGPAAGLVRNMNESLSVPTATTFRGIETKKLEAERASLNAALANAGVKLSFTHIIAYAIIKAWKQFPVMGHSFVEKDSKPHRLSPTSINLGIAVDVEKPDGSRGLMVPVIHRADQLSASGFVEKFNSLVASARGGSLALDDMMGANVTLTNPGGLGTTASVPRLMKGQGTIIATGAIHIPAGFAGLPAERVRDLGISRVMNITSTYDHRVIQGAESGGFLKLVAALLQGENGFYEELRSGFNLAAQAPAAPTSTPGTMPAPPSTANMNGAATRVEVHQALRDEVAIPELETPAVVTAGSDQLAAVAAAMKMVEEYRKHGHNAAHLDPLGAPPAPHADLDPASVGLSSDVMKTIPASVLQVDVPGETCSDILPKLHATYCGTIAYEIEHISDHHQRTWLRHMIESGEHRRPLTSDQQRSLLERLAQVEAFERYVRRAYLTQKQFSIEGVDVVVPMLDELLGSAAIDGTRDVVMGMAHRGRLNILTHITGRTYSDTMRFFEAESRVVEGTEVKGGGTGDVKYHAGWQGQYATPHGDVRVSLLSNPSHLEAVDPVVEGFTRALQTVHEPGRLHHEPNRALAVLLHGDASFAGQGIVAETLNLQALKGYSTGGTIHIITNNQLGFTTEPSEDRSTRYASDLAKGFDIPIIHVNADDPEAAIAAVRLAIAYRKRFAEDVLIDLVGYRRHGHNEGDEPAYTQPLMYNKIKNHPRVREVYALRLSGSDNGENLFKAHYDAISKIHDEVVALGDRPPSELNEPTGDVVDVAPLNEPDTTISAAEAKELLAELVRVPDSFTFNSKLAKQFEKRGAMTEAALDWGAAEALAYATLLRAGKNIRLTGQDTERGTFAHRHMVLHDSVTGEKYAPIKHISGALGSIEVHNSPLTELACLGFEHGYGIARTDDLVIWEAQFGDFVNGAQVMCDQFITSSMTKWALSSRLTLLLPHGYEGNGPEHSNARILRMLFSGAEGNIRVANPTTSAQFFHLLRRQALISEPRPLFVMTPKGLLRAPWAMSPISEFESGRFKWVIDDPAIVGPAERARVTHVVFCSGKVWHDANQHPQRAEAQTTALVRVESLYPFPRKQIRDALSSYPNAREFVWAQEEPINFGPYPYISRHLQNLLPGGAELKYVGRPNRSSASEGFTSVHTVEQSRIVREMLGLQ